mgnify:CR=1 FL=1
MSIALVSLVLAARVLWTLRAVTRTVSTCPTCHGAAVTSDPHGPCAHNPTGLRDCDDCDGHGEVEASPYDSQSIATRALARTAPRAAQDAAAAVLARVDTIGRAALAFTALPISATVREAAHELGADLTGVRTLPDAAWRIAVAIAHTPESHWPDTYTQRAAIGLANALELGELARAEECALWIVRPAVAMDAAIMHITERPGHADCRACERSSKVDSDGLCARCAEEQREAAEASHTGYLAHLDAALSWGPTWDLADALVAVA